MAQKKIMLKQKNRQVSNFINIGRINFKMLNLLLKIQSKTIKIGQLILLRRSKNKLINLSRIN
jgi:hypothetical protein